MANRRDHYRLNAPIALTDESGHTIDFIGIDFLFLREENRLVECRLTVQCAPTMLDWLHRHDHFELAHLTVPIGTPGGHPATHEPRTIELVLDSRLNAALLALGDTDAQRISEFLARLPAPQEPLRLCSNWQARAVYVRHDGVRHGFRRAHNAPTPSPTDQTSLAQVLGALEALTEYAIAQSETTSDWSADAGQQLPTDSDSAHPGTDSAAGDASHFPPNTTLATVFAVMTEDDWQLEVERDPPIFGTAYKGEHGQWECIGYLHDEPAVFVFYSVAWFAVPAHRLQPVAEYITRANQELIFGNFELDYDSGQVRFKTAAAFDTGTFDPDAVRPVIYGNVDSMDHYLPGLLAVAFGGQTPSQALAGLMESPSTHIQ